LKGHLRGVQAVALSADGKLLATAGGWNHRGEIRLWNVDSIPAALPFQGPRKGHGALALSPDGKTLAWHGDKDTVELWDTAADRPRLVLPEPQRGLRALAFSPDNNLVAVACEYTDEKKPTIATLKLWDTRKGKELATLSGAGGQNRGANALAFSP